MGMTIRDVIEDMKLKFSYSKCYDYHEGGKATMGLCNCGDKFCPYNVNNVDKKINALRGEEDGNDD